jgi:hypothetical protein
VVAALECLRIDIVEVAHQQRQVRTIRVQHEVIVIAHQAIGQHLRFNALHALLQNAEQLSTVAVALENRLALVAAGGDVVDRIREFDSQGAGYGAQDCGGGGKRQDLAMGFAGQRGQEYLPRRSISAARHSR